VLAWTGLAKGKKELTFEEQAGLVHVRLDEDPAGDMQRVATAMLTAPQPFKAGQVVSAEDVAACINLSVKDIVMTRHVPTVIGCGLPFVAVEVTNAKRLAASSICLEAFKEKCNPRTLAAGIIVYTKHGISREFDVQSRVYVPLVGGPPEDSATGSANVALTGFLAALDTRPEGTLRFRLAQGYELGRPSSLIGEADKQEGMLVGHPRVGGGSVYISSGTLYLPSTPGLKAKL
jgi:trans-2,3-dihydro-3-hydroxyanthranilate isomerase